jgi:hypothetical protein
MIRNAVKYIVSVLLSIIVAVFAVEFAVRLLPDYVLPSHLRDLVKTMAYRAPGKYAADPDLGDLFLPRTDFESTTSEYSFRIKTNMNLVHAGFRGGTLGGPAWGVAVGDSFTFGLGVNQESTWVARVATLSKREIVNLGVQRTGPQQYTQTLERFGISLQPKIIFYGLFTNDLRDSEQYEMWRRHPTRKVSATTLLQDYSVLYNGFHQWRRARTQGSRYVDLPEAGQKLSIRKLKSEIVEDSRRLPTAWPLIARAIDKALDDSRQANATLVVLYFPSKEEVYWDLIKQQMKSLEAFDDRVDQLRRSTLQFCRSRKVLCLDLTAALKRKAQMRERLYFSIDTHWNELGHEVVAAEIYRFLADQKLL